MADEAKDSKQAEQERRAARESADLKVTDKRMFTAAGELREEYRFLDEKGKSPAPPPPPRKEPEAERKEPVRKDPERREPPRREPERREPPREAASDPRHAPAPERGAHLEIPGTPPGLGPSFFDLVAMLAEPVSIYLGDIQLPDGQSAENLEMARIHIDLLDLLRQKTRGNVTAQESTFLEDLLYRLRMRYVQKRG
jgi:hypothetical protein